MSVNLVWAHRWVRKPGLQGWDYEIRGEARAGQRPTVTVTSHWGPVANVAEGESYSPRGVAEVDAAVAEMYAFLRELAPRLAPREVGDR